VRQLVGQGVTVLLTTQYLEEADELADQIVVMDHGRAVASGTPAELKAQIGGQRVDVVAFDDDAFARLAAAFDGRFTLSVVPERRLLSVPAPRESVDLLEVSRIIAEARIAVEEVALRRPTLDDTFLALTGQSGDTSDFDRIPEEVPA
jgi:ABC-2 type transport system ATP-binding protein